MNAKFKILIALAAILILAMGASSIYFGAVETDQNGIVQRPVNFWPVVASKDIGFSNAVNQVVINIGGGGPMTNSFLTTNAWNIFTSTAPSQVLGGYALAGTTNPPPQNLNWSTLPYITGTGSLGLTAGFGLGIVTNNLQLGYPTNLPAGTLVT